jgi:hypothetical protein
MPLGRFWPRRRLWHRRHTVRVAIGAPITSVATERRLEAIAEVQAFFDERQAALASANAP